MASKTDKNKDDGNWPVQKTDSEWRDSLTPEQYHVTREAGTERAFTGPYVNDKTEGIYHCVFWYAPRFLSDPKYDSGSGWPSFFQPVTATAVAEKSDNSHMMQRTEILCNHCGSHLGHVFPDGPAPTGLRYCMNGTALKLKPKTD